MGQTLLDGSLILSGSIPSSKLSFPVALTTVDYANRSTLRAGTPISGSQALVDGLGLFVFYSGSTEPDDDESCFVTSNGAWLLEAPHWDVVDDWNLPDNEFRDADDADEPIRFSQNFGNVFPPSVSGSFTGSLFTGSFSSSFYSKVLRGTILVNAATLAATSSVSYTTTITGASPNGADVVVASPPNSYALGNTTTDSARLGFYVYISGINTITLILTNASSATATTNVFARTYWPVAVIKGA